jgi:hypothetical protein
MLFSNAPSHQKPIPAFAVSGIGHLLAILLIASWSVDLPQSTTVHTTKKYSIRFLQLEIPREHRSRASSESREAGAEGSHAQLNGNPGGITAPRSQKGAGEESESRILAQSSTTEHRRFTLPPHARIKTGKQTIVQLDLPPEISLNNEIPLPTALLWTQPVVQPMRRRFVAPPIKKLPKVAQSLPSAPDLNLPNQETSVGAINMAAAFINDTPQLVHPPAVASPVTSAGQEKAKEIPQIGVANSNEPSPANLITLPNTPLRASTVFAIPPANEVAPAAGATTGSPSGTASTDGNGKAVGTGTGDALGGSGTGGSGTASNGANGNGSGANGEGARANGSGASGGMRAGTGTGSSGSGAGSGTRGNGEGDSNGRTGGDGSGNTMGTATPGLTRMNLPKDGKFSVIVLGSADSTRYPESVGALSGKVVYTVYLKLGLRKSWILQYCFPNVADRKLSAKTSTTPIEAPWPFLIMRPDYWSDSDPDYIMVHGILTEAGQLDQLVMVFPDELEKKDSLLHALKLWAFRPASRDGEPTAVEVLLIIPHEAG